MWQCSHITLSSCHTYHLAPRCHLCSQQFLVRAKSDVSLAGLKCCDKVKGRPPLATHSCHTLLKRYQGYGNACRPLFPNAIHVILRQKAIGVENSFGSKPNLMHTLQGSNTVMRWKKGLQWQPTSVTASSRDTTDVALLPHHSF